MRVHASGSGSPAIVLVPGGPGLTPSFYAELIEGLARFGTVRTVAFSGTHPDPQTPFPETVEEAADELEAAISTLPDDRATVVVGHSYGAAVVIELLCREKKRAIDGAILISGFPSGDFLARSVAARMKQLPRAFHEAWVDARGDAEATAELTSEFWYPAHFCRVPWPDSFVEGASKLNPLFLSHVLGLNIFEPNGTIRQWDREACLPLTDVPLLVSGGTEDYYDPEALRKLYSVAGPDHGDVEFLFSDEASHSIWIEDPDPFWRGMQTFLNRVGQGTATWSV